MVSIIFGVGCLGFFQTSGVHRVLCLLFWQDDVRLCTDFFGRAESLWNGITDTRKVSLNIFVDESRVSGPVWTKVEPKQVGNVWKTQWVDGLYIANRRYLEALRYSVPPVSASRWKRDPSLSSGVGQNISLKLHRASFGMYRVDKSLVVHVEAKSQLNPIARRQQPLRATRYIDGDEQASQLSRSELVSVSLASIPSRQKQLALTIGSLLPQVDKIYVYLNGYESKPEYLNHDRIEVAFSQEHGDLGDAGKFFWCEQLDGYVLTCDDDIIYPSDYASRMIKAIEIYARQAVVGVHGVILRWPMQSYYRSRDVFHFERALPAPQPVHVVGTGCTAYHTSTLSLQRSLFELPNMADIWLGLACQLSQTPMMVVDRSNKWLKAQEVPSSIYSDFSRRDLLQTKVVNRLRRWHLRMPTV